MFESVADSWCTWKTLTVLSLVTHTFYMCQLSHMDSWDTDCHTLLCCLSGLYKLGKESLLLELAMEFKTWIEVSFERMQTLRALELPDVFTTDPGAGRIRVVEQSAICSTAVYQWNRDQPTLAILPTSRPLVSFHPSVHVVPYSDHSSYQELKDFVSALKPNSIVPIVGNYVPGSLSALVPSRKRHEILVPESVQHYMLRQPDSQLSSSEYSSIRRRHFRPLAPKGVVFESPVRGSKMSCEEASEAECLEQDDSEEEMDTESSEKDSDCILVDLTKDLSSNKHGRGAADMWYASIGRTVSEDMVPLSQLTHSSFAPVESMTNSKACSTPVSTMRRPVNTDVKTINSTTPSDYTQQHSGHGDQNSLLSDGDSTSQQSEHGIDQDDDIVSNDNSPSQHYGHGTDQNDNVTLTQKSRNHYSHTSSHSSALLRQEYIEKIENSILDDLPFTRDDFKLKRPVMQSFVKQFPLCPVYHAKKTCQTDSVTWCSSFCLAVEAFLFLCVKTNILEKISLEKQVCNHKLMSLSLDWTCNVLENPCLHPSLFAVKKCNFWINK